MKKRIENVLKKLGIKEELEGFKILAAEIEKVVEHRGVIGIGEVVQSVACETNMRTQRLMKCTRIALDCVDTSSSCFERYVGFLPITNMTFVQNVAINLLKEDKAWRI